MKEKNPAAVALGSMTSEKKAETARENGKKGGRPKVCNNFYSENENCKSCGWLKRFHKTN